jgi:uroporphyrinogen-III synthase
VVGPQTREALNKRAHSAVIVMERSAEILSKALSEQTPPKPGGKKDWFRPQPQPPEKIELDSKEVQRMVYDLYRWAAEMKKFTWLSK